jgi:hypothetical protein
MNLVASLQDRLKNQAREQDIAYASLLEQFALSRFFVRLAQSAHANRFVLKGAQLFRFLERDGHRPTRDADFLSLGDHEPETLKAIFTEICQLAPEKADALTHSISEGLPREIEMRQKQYEYYRDLLLNFPKPEPHTKVTA